MSSGPDEEQLEFGRARRRRQWRLALILGAIVLGPLTWLLATEVQVANAKRDARLNASQKAELSALLDQREAIAKERVSRWNAAVQPEALATLTIGTGDCPLKLEPPAQLSAAAYVKYGTHDDAFGAWQLCILRSVADAPPCTRQYVVAPEIARLRTLIADDDVYSWNLEKAKSAPPDMDPPSILISAGLEVRPQAQSRGVGRVTFVPGTLSGRGFLFDPAQGRFVCGGEVSVRNSKTVDIEFTTFGEGASAQQNTAEYETRVALERDLEIHLRFAAPKAMVLLNVP